MYQKVVALDRQVHAEARLPTETTPYDFAVSTNSVPLLGIEFGEACRSFPVLFATDARGDTFPIALLGLQPGRNLFVAKGEWATQTYVPAFIRRYPLITADDGTVAIDGDFSGPEAGERFFNDAGENTPALDRALNFLSQYQAEIGRTRGFVARLKEFGLLRDWAIQAVAPNGETFSFPGVQVIDEQALLKLDDAIIIGLFRAGELFWIQAHLLSLGSLPRLLARLAPA